MNDDLTELSKISAENIFRKFFLESLSSSPTISSSSSQSLSSINVSVDTCIEHLRLNVSKHLPNDVLDQFRRYVEKCAPSGRVNWKAFKEASERWIVSLNPKWQDNNNNIDDIKSDDTVDSPDEGTADESEGFNKNLDDSGKLSEFVEWSIIPATSMANDTTSEFEKTDVSIKSPKGFDSAKLCEAELRNRVRQFDEDNALLRDELVRIEELASTYQQKFYSARQKLDCLKDRFNQLERENEEQKEVIANMELQEKRCQVALEKVEKKQKSYVQEIDINKQLIPTLKAKIEKLTANKINYTKQLSEYKKKLEEKEDNCELLKDELEQLTKLKNSLEEYYEKTIRNLQERYEDLKKENLKLQPRFSTGNSLMDMSFIHSMHLNVSENFPEEEHKNSLPDSLYEEIKATGFSINDSANRTKVQELEEELCWYNDEIFRIIKQVNLIIRSIQEKQLSSDKRYSEDVNDIESSDIVVLVEKISVLSKAVTEVIHKSSTSEASCQVFAEPLESRVLNEFQILSFKNNLSSIDTQQSSESGEAFFIAPPVAVNQENAEIQSSIYTHKSRPNKRRWGRNFRAELSAMSSEDDSIGRNSSLLLQSTNELESKISLCSAVVVGDTEEEKDEEITRKNIFFNQHSSLSPITPASKLNEKNVPRRKLSVFSRSIDMDKMLEPQCTEMLTSSTPSQHTFSPTSYRTTVDSSDSSNSLPSSHLDTTPEDDKINCHFMPTIRETSVVLAPAKLTLPIQANKTKLDLMKTLNDSVTQVQDQQKENPKTDITWNIQTDVDSAYHGSSSSDIRVVSEKAAVKPSAVTLAMSSAEDSSDSSDSEQVVNDNKQSIEKTDKKSSKVIQSAGEMSVCSESHVNVINGINDKTYICKPSNKRKIGNMKRSRSESESLENRCTCSTGKFQSNYKMQRSYPLIFPNLSDSRLQESGIANLLDNDKQEKDLSESELEKKYIAFSLGLCTNKLTLSRRKAFSIRQRDQSERNLTGEISRMSQNIEELAPLCFDSETIDRIERAKNQVDIIAQCARKVSWAAELLGAIQQEHRISRAVHVADKYLQLLRSRCEKLEADLAETKRILTENNIVIDEHNVETGEELTTIRYRGLPTANRTMISRRRASIATIFRPIVPGQDNTKEGVRQRNSVSGRVTVRRPSFSADAQRWEVEKLNKTESSNSVGELCEIFEHIESRRGSKEENNNIIVQLVTNTEASLPIAQTTIARSYNTDELPVAIINEEEPPQSDSRALTIMPLTGYYPMSWRAILWCIIISFLIGFYMKDVVSSKPCSETRFRWWSLEEILGRNVERRSSSPLPI